MALASQKNQLQDSLTREKSQGEKVSTLLSVRGCDFEEITPADMIRRKKSKINPCS
jgi:hypothetical protein